MATNRLHQAMGLGSAFPFRRAADLERAAEEEAHRITDALSSGPYSSAQLAAMGHPYGRGGGAAGGGRSRRGRRGRSPAARQAPPLPPWIINEQTGLFRRSWQIRARVSRGVLTVEAENTAPHARFLLGGTRRMIARPFMERLRQELAANLPRIVARVLGRR